MWLGDGITYLGSHGQEGSHLVSLYSQHVVWILGAQAWSVFIKPAKPHFNLWFTKWWKKSSKVQPSFPLYLISLQLTRLCLKICCSPKFGKIHFFILCYVRISNFYYVGMYIQILRVRHQQLYIYKSIPLCNWRKKKLFKWHQILRKKGKILQNTFKNFFNIEEKKYSKTKKRSKSQLASKIDNTVKFILCINKWSAQPAIGLFQRNSS